NRQCGCGSLDLLGFAWAHEVHSISSLLQDKRNESILRQLFATAAVPCGDSRRQHYATQPSHLCPTSVFGARSAHRPWADAGINARQGQRRSARRQWLALTQRRSRGTDSHLRRLGTRATLVSRNSEGRRFPRGELWTRYLGGVSLVGNGPAKCIGAMGHAAGPVWLPCRDARCQVGAPARRGQSDRVFARGTERVVSQWSARAGARIYALSYSRKNERSTHLGPDAFRQSDCDARSRGSQPNFAKPRCGRRALFRIDRHRREWARAARLARTC